MNPDNNPDYNHDEPWFNQKNNFNSKKRLLAPFNHITVGSHPTDGMTKEQATTIDAYVNVSSNAKYMFTNEKPRNNQEFLWNPTTEYGYWGYIPLFLAKKNLDRLYKEEKEIYLHCAAGVGRSPLIAMTWLVSLGYTLDKINAIMEGDKYNSEFPNSFENKFYLYYKRGLLPPFSDMQEFYRRIDTNPDTWELDSILTQKPALISWTNRSDQDNLFKELGIKRDNEHEHYLFRNE